MIRRTPNLLIGPGSRSWISCTRRQIAAEQNSRQAVEAARRLAQQLQAARDRIAQLESDLVAYRDRAERSELWLDKIRTEIEQQFPTSGRKPER